ncbi:MAG TPA: bifunctional riboflavin kinase/FAD synthetase [Acidimicrobiales bacterium]|jgi:riboflavin kinase/FMN adenylyltransferase|nr:bifunctional riboflavin kinase/FAD synthetase [Acidimicrobiales bacterium]
MEVLRDMAGCPLPVAGSAVTIGAYDGVHVGHRAVIEEVRARASTLGLPTAVVTFDRHPAAVVRPVSAPKLLTDTDQKLELLAAVGVDYTLVLHFDEDRSHESAEDFVNEVLVGCLRARLVVVGEDFHFGRKRGGNVELLRRMGPNLGFEVEGLGLVHVPGLEGPVSSTVIRAELLQGDVVAAARLLGRPHEVRGVVEKGDGRGGAILGFPTANVAVPAEILLPADGIYAGWYERPDGSTHATAISIGRRPTFYPEGGPLMVEAYLLDFEGDLYGERARVRFVSRLRGEERFESTDALVAQMNHDVEAARAALGSA